MKALISSRALAAFSAIILFSESWLLQAQQPSTGTGTVVEWEYPTTPFNNAVPAGLEDVIAIAAGWIHSVALKKDGTVVAWGTRYSGSVPMTAPVSLNGVVAIAAGFDHDLAVRKDGTVVAWGDNTFGQLAVPANLSGVVAVAGGAAHSLAVKYDGTVVAWGLNNHGQCSVPIGLSNVVAVAAGFFHSLALKQDGTVVAWGTYFDGTGNYDVPMYVPDRLTGVVAIAGGEYYSLALKQDGTVIAWGYNQFGECDVPSGLSGVVAITGSRFPVLALKNNGTIVAWGRVFDEVQQQEVPWPVPAGLSNVVAVATGSSHCLALVYPGRAEPTNASVSGSQTFEAGSGALLSAKADGAPPMGYYWFLNGTNAVQSGPSWILQLSNLQPAQAGAYSVIISNRFGSATSPPAILSVIPTVPRMTVPALHVAGDVGSLVHIRSAENAGSDANWQELDAIRLTNSPQIYFDSSQPFVPDRFYRAWQTNTASAKPELQMTKAVKITLAGTVGSKIRIDYINKYGPTDAWVTLDTVILTNATQDYFDLTISGQPPRLYRLVPLP